MRKIKTMNQKMALLQLVIFMQVVVLTVPLSIIMNSQMEHLNWFRLLELMENH